MKNKAGLILLILIIISIIGSGCTGDKLQRADEYMAKGNMKKAERLYKKLIQEKNNQGGYKGLIKIYESQNQMEKLSEIVERSIEDGHTPEEEGIYIRILEYYDSINNREKIIELIGDKFSHVNLPITVYKNFLLKDKLPEDMDIIEMKSGDLTNDGQNEIAVVMAIPEKEINMNYYKEVKVQVYNLKGQVIYEDSEDGGYLLYPKINMVDLNNDGVKDLYYNVIYDSVTNAFTMAKVLTFKDNIGKLIYSEGIKDLDIDIEIISEKSYRIYSKKMDKSYDIVLDDSSEELLDPEKELKAVKWEIYEKLSKDESGRDVLETNFEIKGYGSIKIEYGYIEGEIRPIDFKVEPINGTVE